MTDARFDILTVVFMAELPLLELQARSMARHLPPALVGRIMVVPNDWDEAGCIAGIERLRAHYGPLADKLDILRPDTLVAQHPRHLRGLYLRHLRGRLRRLLPRRDRLAGGWRGNSGWAMQQAFKLLGLRAATAPYVLLLDAKNHFLRPVAAADFVAADGRARSRRVEMSALQRGWLAASARKLGVAVPADAPPTVTPVVIARAPAQAAVARLDARLGPLEEVFALDKGKATEFMLLCLAVELAPPGWWAQFAEGLPAALTVFGSGEDPDIAAALSQAGADNPLLFGLHRRALWRARATRQRLGAFFVDHGLFGQAAEAEAFLAGVRAQ